MPATIAQRLRLRDGIGGRSGRSAISPGPRQEAPAFRLGRNGVRRAFSAFFAKRARYPRFKSRQGRQSATYTRSAFRMKNAALWLAKTGAPLAFVWSWPEIDPATLDPTTVTVSGEPCGRWYVCLAVDPATLDPTTVTISREPCGRWYVCLAIDAADPGQSPATGAVVGVDLGIKDFAVTSDGVKIANPPSLARRERNLARRRLAAGLAVGAGTGADACGADVRRHGTPVRSRLRSRNSWA